MQKTLAIFIILIVVTVCVSEVDMSSGPLVLQQSLFAIRSNGLALPIDLVYQSGIKINQHASWVGLGFDISLPYVERTPVGSADEKSAYVSHYCGTNYQRKHYDKLLLPTGNGYSSTPAAGYFTGEQDVYVLNAPFASGRILFAQPTASERMMAYLQNWRAVKTDYEITTTAGDANITKWTFTDESGVIYIFGKAVRIGTVDANGRRVPTVMNELASYMGTVFLIRLELTFYVLVQEKKSLTYQVI